MISLSQSGALPSLTARLCTAATQPQLITALIRALNTIVQRSSQLQVASSESQFVFQQQVDVTTFEMNADVLLGLLAEPSNVLSQAVPVCYCHCQGVILAASRFCGRPAWNQTVL